MEYRLIDPDLAASSAWSAVWRIGHKQAYVNKLRHKVRARLDQVTGWSNYPIPQDA